MSKLIDKKVVVVNTELGAMTVATEVLYEFDIEDLIRSRAESQALLIQTINAAKNANFNSSSPDVLTTDYTSTEEDLDELN